MQPLLIAMPGESSRVRRLADRIGADWIEPGLQSFPDGESYVRIEAELEDRDVAIVSALDRPDPKFLKLRFLAETARDGGADTVGLVAPYLAYMRQDEQFSAGEGLTSRYFADLISGTFDWLVTVEPHLHRHAGLEDLYSIPTRCVAADLPIANWVERHVDDPVLVGPDEEARQWVSAVADRGDHPMLVLEKTRYSAYDVEIEAIDDASILEGTPVVIDDIISTGRTMIEAVERIAARTDTAPICIGIHGLFADDARGALADAGVDRIVTCNTVADKTNDIDILDVLADGIDAMLSSDVSTTVVQKAGH